MKQEKQQIKENLRRVETGQMIAYIKNEVTDDDV